MTISIFDIVKVQFGVDANGVKVSDDKLNDIVALLQDSASGPTDGQSAWDFFQSKKSTETAALQGGANEYVAWSGSSNSPSAESYVLSRVTGPH